MKNVKSLNDIQTEFQSYLHGKTTYNTAQNLILSSPHFSSQQRLKVYTDAYRIRIINSLKEDFPTVSDKIFIDFLFHNPSRRTNLSEYSEDFVDYVEIHDAENNLDVVKRWAQIVCERQFEIYENEVVKQKEVSVENSLKISRHPRTFLKKWNNRYYLASARDNQFTFSEVMEIDFRFINYFEKPVEVSHVENVINQSDVPLEDQLQLLTKWLGQRILILVKK